jgi:hypothetical protein
LRQGREELDAYGPALDLLAENANRFSETLASGLARALIAGEDLGETLERIGLQLAEFALSSVLGAAIGQAPVGGAGGSGLLGALFGGGRQHGGPVSAGRAYVVGEGGRPELFVPDTAGTIIPDMTRMMGGGGRGTGWGAPAPDVRVDARPTIHISNTAGPGVQVAASPPRIGADGNALVDVMVSQSIDRLHSGGALDRMTQRRTGIRRS